MMQAENQEDRKMSGYAVLDGYIIRRTTEKAIALVKEGAGPMADLIWVPRGWCRDGDTLEVGDTDLMVFTDRAIEKNLDY
jgi:hypothetical protein